MSYLLDTNVVSELLRPKPNLQVVAWFKDKPNESLYLSVLSLGEIRKGVERLQGGARKERLRLWLEQELPAWFGDRFMPVAQGVADRWGRLLAQAERTPGAIDSLIAATALHHGLRLVTRNEADFRFDGLEIVNPWRSA
ncbi:MULTISPECIES: type II toxin-antitoxin system VapC family toxin [Rhodomicrobium]|uniref:type II toxin-antitoxin system VapC family toxin n=1 Tax=Rhodomicrobium TaxID=1068 RepID=UPI000B4AC03B|nr:MULTISPECIES: type II toxin-antitoxin system VapC family toxin [Rhodomicrobium]